MTAGITNIIELTHLVTWWYNDCWNELQILLLVFKLEYFQGQVQAWAR